MKAGRGLPVLVALLAAACFPAGANAEIVVKHSKAKPVPAGQQVSGKARCPDGLRVSGGGVYTSGSSLEDEASDSAPFDAGDRDEKPDDGWIGGVNAGAASTSMRVWVICTDAVKLYYRSAPAAPESFGGEARPACRSGDTVVGGGMLVKGKSVSSPLKASILGLIPPQFWESSAINLSSPADQATGFAICTPSTRIVENGGSKNLNPASQGSFTANCPSGSHILSGGGAGSQSEPIEIASLLPSDGPDSRHRPDDAWTMWFNNESASETESMNSHALCLD